MPRTLLALSLLASLAPLVGCGGFSAPKIRVVDARVLEQTEHGVSVDFVLEGQNDNSEEIPLQVVRYSLSIDGERVFTGERMAEATLRRFGTQTFVLPVAAEWEDLPNDRPEGDLSVRTRRYRLAGTLQYIAPGALAEVFFDTGVRRPSVRFVSEGELTVSPSVDDEPADIDVSGE
ncbi:MAG: LEA type 2 family protein [Phycisphaerales bacterium]